MSGNLVILMLAGRRFALPAEQVRECLPLPRLWRRDSTPPHVAGFFSLGGTMLPVLDLCSLLGLRDAAAPIRLEAQGLYRHLVRVDEATLLVDRVTQLAHAPEPIPAPSTGHPESGWQNGCVVGWRLVEGEPVALLDAALILRRDEQEQLAQLAGHAATRRLGWDGQAVNVD